MASWVYSLLLNYWHCKDTDIYILDEDMPIELKEESDGIRIS